MDQFSGLPEVRTNRMFGRRFISPVYCQALIYGETEDFATAPSPN
jgi:hypothetical protein